MTRMARFILSTWSWSVFFGITQPVDPYGENKELMVKFLCLECMSGPVVQAKGMYRSSLDFPM